MQKLDELLDFLENNIDDEHLKNVEKLHLDAMNCKDVPYLPLTLVYPPEGVKPFPYEEAFYDPEKMLFNELISTVGGTSTYNSVRLNDHFPLQIRSNHGIGILASLFGAECKIVNNNMPWIEHLEFSEIKELISKGVPDLDKGLGKRVIDTHKYYIDRLKEYPKCSRNIRITQPDLQGPFDIAHILIGGDIFYGVYDYPDIIHELLDIITNTYIEFRRKIDGLLTDSAGDDAVYLHGCIFGGKVLIKDDTAMINLSEEMHCGFSKQYNDKIFEAFGGGSHHFCGLSRPWHFKNIDSPWLKGVNYGNPEMQNLSEVYKFWSERKIPNLLWGDTLCGYRMDYDYLEEVQRLNIKTGMSLAIRVDSFEEARNVLKKHISQEA